jgi:hypothetical protein
MQCAICFRPFVPAEHSYVVANELYLVPTPPGTPPRIAAHLLCWIIRLLVSDARLQIIRAQAFRVPAPVPPEHDYSGGTGGATPRCGLCGEGVRGDDTVVRLVGCAHAETHFACFSLTCNARSQLFCDAVQCAHGGGPAADRLVQYTQTWSGLPEYKAYNEVRLRSIRAVQDRDPAAPSAAGSVWTEAEIAAVNTRAMSASMIEHSAPSLLIDACRAAGGPYVTPVKRLCNEIVDTGHVTTGGGATAADGKIMGTQSPLIFMMNCKYSGYEMVRMGLRFGMLFQSPNDWKHLLNKKEFDRHVLMREEMNANFTRMLLAGMDIAKFVAAGYDFETVRDLRFNIPAFLAAGGTRGELKTLLGVTDESFSSVRERWVEVGLEDLKLNDVQ